jgi:hypothetical protein
MCKLGFVQRMKGCGMKKLLWILLGSAIAFSALGTGHQPAPRSRRQGAGHAGDPGAAFQRRVEGQGPGPAAGCAGTGKQGIAAAPCPARSRRQHGFLRHPAALSSLARGHARGRAEARRRQFYPQIADAVDDASGRIQALPLALSLPVLFTNRASLAQGRARSRPADQDLVGTAEGGRGDLRPAAASVR